MGKKFMTWFKASFIGYGVSALAIVMIAMTQHLVEAARQPFQIVVALMFYVGLLVGIVATVKVSRMRQVMQKRSAKVNSLLTQRAPGVISFKVGVINIVLYSVFAAGLIICVVDILTHSVNSTAMFGVIAVTYLAFVMHCIVDGKNYKIYKLLMKGEKNGDSK